MLAAVLLALLAAAPPAAPAAAPAEVEAAVRAAIVRAVAARVGAAVDVGVEALRVHGPIAAAGLEATPDAGSRAGGPMRFILRGGAGAAGRRVGSADAIVRLQGRHARAVRALGPGVVVAAGDVADAVGDPGLVPLRPLPQAAALLGARLRRAVAAGGAVAADAVTAAPLVRSGDEVSTRVRVGAVTAHGRATALDDGAAGAIVRLQVEKRRLRGRVRAAGEVEVTP